MMALHNTGMSEGRALCPGHREAGVCITSQFRKDAHIHCCFKLLGKSVALQIEDVRLMRLALLALSLQEAAC